MVILARPPEMKMVWYPPAHGTFSGRGENLYGDFSFFSLLNFNVVMIERRGGDEAETG